MHLRSARLLLRQAQPSDAPDFLRLDRDPEVMRFLGGVAADATLARSQRRVAELVENYGRRPGLGLWPCFTRDDSTFVGWFMLNPARISVLGDDDSAQQRVEIGYRLTAESWGQGYATEMTHELLSYGFGQLALPEVWAVVSPENRRSIRVLEKTGFRYRGLATYKAPIANVSAYSIAHSSSPEGGPA